MRRAKYVINLLSFVTYQVHPSSDAYLAAIISYKALPFKKAEKKLISLYGIQVIWWRG
ncbi:hypothetical protein Hanom_Chr14g01271951 [Helianthus anomalus]